MLLCACVLAFLPTAQIIPVTLLGGLLMPAWCDVKDLKDHASRPEFMDYSVSEIVELIAEEGAKYGVMPHKVVLAGFSMGAHMAAWIGLQLPAKLAGMVIVAGGPWALNHCKISEMGKMSPLLSCHGADDALFPESYIRRVCEQLEEQGCTIASRRVFDGLAHAINEEEIVYVEEFLRQRLPDEARVAP